MTKQGGMGDRLFVNGVDVSGDIGSLGNIGGGPAPGEVTDITQSAISRLGLLRDGRIEFTSWLNPSAGRQHKTLSVLPQTDVQMMYLRGTGIGSPAACLVAKQVNYDPNREASGALSWSTSTQGNGTGLEWGEQLTAGIRTDTVATNGTGYDGLASSAFGGQAYLQVFAFTGTSVTVKIQDSADNATFADVTGLTFTAAVTSPGVQRLQTLNTATIRRYTRAITTGTFSNAQFAVAFVRNQSLGVLF